MRKKLNLDLLRIDYSPSKLFPRSNTPITGHYFTFLLDFGKCLLGYNPYLQLFEK